MATSAGTVSIYTIIVTSTATTVSVNSSSTDCNITTTNSS